MGKRTIKYGSVCSGIEAASVAWEPLGWEAQWFAEIEHFPSAVLAHRFPSVPNLGDMTRIHEQKQFQDATINLLVGGTPCQSFSVAGLRKGLDDSRGGLMLTFVELAARKRPSWVVWENVPGVLSSNKGKDFAAFLGLLTGREVQPPVGGWKNSGCIDGIGAAYGIAWRILDAQFFGVAQRRRRVFVVGYLGDWRPAAAVLFEQDSLSGNPKKGRKKGETVAPDAQGGPGSRGEQLKTFAGNIESDTAATLQTTCDDYSRADGFNMIAPAFKVRGGMEGGGKGYLGQDETAFTISTTQDQQIAQPIAFQQNTRDEVRIMSGHGQVAGALGAETGSKQQNYIATPVPFRKARRAQNKDDHETWEQDEKTNTLNAFDTGDIRTTQAVIQPIAVDVYNQTIDGQTAATITEAVGGSNTSGPKVAQPTIIDRAAFNQRENAQYEPRIEQGETMSSLVAKGPHAVAHTMAIRRLTPTETERLQGFPDGWTKIPYRNKPAEDCPDGPRYKACGNSMAVPCMFWIGKRIQMVEDILQERNA